MNGLLISGAELRNAGFIRQRLKPSALLPDKSGVPSGKPLIARTAALSSTLRALKRGFL
jgi:hypothetical protein